MKPAQRLRYAERIERVLLHLESTAADAMPTLPELARIASMSEYHFYRVFRLMTGETVGNVVRRVKLARAVPALVADASVGEAADAAGYSTPQSLARAVKAQTGNTPSALRDDLSLFHTALQSARPTPRGAGPIPALTVDIVSLSPLRLLAIRNTGAYAELNAAYGRLLELVAAQVEPAAIAGIYGIWFDDERFTPSTDCRAVCAFDVGPLGTESEDLEVMTISGGECVRIHHRGSYDRLSADIDTLYAYAIATQTRELAAQPPLIHFLDDPDETPEADLRADVYLALQ